MSVELPLSPLGIDLPRVLRVSGRGLGWALDAPEAAVPGVSLTHGLSSECFVTPDLKKPTIPVLGTPLVPFIFKK